MYNNLISFSTADSDTKEEILEEEMMLCVGFFETGIQQFNWIFNLNVYEMDCLGAVNVLPHLLV